MSWAIVDLKQNFPILSSEGRIQLFYPLPEKISCHPTFFLASISPRLLLIIFKVSWCCGFANNKHGQLFPSCTCNCHAFQSSFAILATRTLFSRQMIRFSLQILIKQTKLIPLNIFFNLQLDSKVARALLFHGAVNSPLTADISPFMVLKLIPFLKNKISSYIRIVTWNSIGLFIFFYY